jgi:undecaprenyl-diphosphatase
MNWIEAVILGLVEGITEFLPISSTGHLILTRSLLGLEGEAVNRQLIVIQGAAILAVCWEYRRRLWDTLRTLHTRAESQRLAVNVSMAFLPLATLGLLFEQQIESALFAPVPVALALIIGGVLMMWAERRPHRTPERIATIDDMRWPDAMKLGLFQALALIPGTSRSAATIIGGMLSGMSRRAATEFSFFVAIPTLLGATGYQLWKARDALSWAEAETLAISSAVAFISALASVRWLLRYIARHSFVSFAWYRIGFGALVLATWAMGVIRW